MPYVKHGHNRKGNKSKIYQAWDSMIQRCNNTNWKQFHDYGGRGIKVCDQWKDFQQFLADVGEPLDTSLTLDRIDNSLGYQPGNVRWATRKEQQRNTRQNRTFTVLGVTGCVADLCIQFGINRNTVNKRLRAGVPPERAFTETVDERYSH